VSQAAVIAGMGRILGRVGLYVFFEFFTSAEWVLSRVRMQRPDLPVVIESVGVSRACRRRR
jgi:hypothetical protein